MGFNCPEQLHLVLPSPPMAQEPISAQPGVVSPCCSDAAGCWCPALAVLTMISPCDLRSGMNRLVISSSALLLAQVPQPCPAGTSSQPLGRIPPLAQAWF